MAEEKATFRSLIGQIPVRFADFLVKLMSVKGIVFILVTWWFSVGKLNFMEWFAGASLLIGVRAVEKAIDKIKK